MEHELKVWPAYFKRLADGSKTFEIRRNDRGFQQGDTLRLREYDPDGTHDDCDDPACTKRRYTGAMIRRRVGFVASGTLFGLSLGEHVVLSLLPTNPTTEEGNRA
jgi:Domain of unknown function (DUF3850)